MNIQQELLNIIKAKRGNKEIGLFFDGKAQWTLVVGNCSDCTGLGEEDGELQTEGSSMERVIYLMNKKLNM